MYLSYRFVVYAFQDVIEGHVRAYGKKVKACVIFM